MIKIVNMLPRLHHLPNGLGTLKPGLNMVEDDKWKEALKFPSVNRKVDLGMLVPNSDRLPPLQTAPISTPAGPSSGPKPSKVQKVDEKPKSRGKATEGDDEPKGKGELAEFPEADVIELVSVEEEVDRLQGWLKGEGRKAVKKAIADRITVLRSSSES